MIRKIQTWIDNRKKRRGNIKEKNMIHPQTRKAIQLAFTWKGVKYYKYKQDLYMPSSRYFTAQTFYNELDMRVDREFMQSFLKASKKCIDKGEVSKLGFLLYELEQRLDWLVEQDILLRLASVLYFTLDENLETYDQEYNDKKIEAWKEAGDLAGFFLTLPIANFLPFSNLSVEDLSQYLKAQNVKGQAMLRLHSEYNSRNKLKSKITQPLNSPEGT